MPTTLAASAGHASHYSLFSGLAISGFALAAIGEMLVNRHGPSRPDSVAELLAFRILCLRRAYYDRTTCVA